ANGGAWSIAKAVFNALGADTYVCGDRPNGLNINRNVGSTHIENLQNFVLENRLDVGFAYDGDADRCLAVDERGQVVTGDHILYLYSRYMKERGKLIGNAVVATAQSNFGLFQSLQEAGIDTVKTDVGDKYVYEAMKQGGYRIGGEQTGHIIFSKYATTGDGILTSLKVMQAMLAKKKKLSELAGEMRVYPQVQESVRVSDKEGIMKSEKLQDLLEEVRGELSGSGSLLVRPSGTEPVIRVGVEAETKERAEALKERITSMVRELDGRA
ncbi:MAG: phosphoglucosamine mutase, partial [Lachnospiraceae bacterium]